MGYLDAFLSSTALIKSLGKGNAHLIWAMGLYMEEPDLEALAARGESGQFSRRDQSAYGDRLKGDSMTELTDERRSGRHRAAEVLRNGK